MSPALRKSHAVSAEDNLAPLSAALTFYLAISLSYLRIFKLPLSASCGGPGILDALRRRRHIHACPASGVVEWQQICRGEGRVTRAASIVCGHGRKLILLYPESGLDLGRDATCKRGIRLPSQLQCAN